jgi:hypothetical protein
LIEQNRLAEDIPLNEEGKISASDSLFGKPYIQITTFVTKSQERCNEKLYKIRNNCLSGRSLSTFI